LRRFASFTFACMLLVYTGIACAQHVDVAVGGNTLWSSHNPSDAVGFLPPPIKGGVYPSATLQYIFPNRFGLNIEGSFRYNRTFYNGYQPYRPFLYDVNGVFAPRFTPKMSGDFMAGVGAQTVLFYNEFAGCGAVGGGCRVNINSTHLLFHAGAGVRYYFWRNFFARPEAHWYYVVNNTQFHSDNVFRVGASVGYTFGSR
jgi:hypothetical protein